MLFSMMTMALTKTTTMTIRMPTEGKDDGSHDDDDDVVEKADTPRRPHVVAGVPAVPDDGKEE